MPIIPESPSVTPEQLALVQNAELPMHPPTGWIPEVRVQPEATTVEMRMQPSRRVGRIRKLAGKTALVLGVYASLSSGGLIDKALDPFQDASSVVHGAVPNQEDMEELTLDQMTERERNAANDKGAWDHVAQIMNDLDEHRSGTIQERADKYAAEHADEIMPEDKIKSYHDRINQATNNHEAILALTEFGREFDMYVGWSETDSAKFAAFNMNSTVASDTKRTANAFVNVIGRLPKSFVAKMNVTQVTLANSKTAAAGMYQPTIEMLTVATRSTFGDVASEIQRRFPGMDESKDEWVIAHEFGHGYLEVTDDSISDVSSNMLQHAFGQLLQMPTSNTLYAEESTRDEKVAEAFAGVLTPDSVSGLAHPDESRRFNSAANAKMLRVLAQLESENPGISDYIVSLNSHLLNRSPFDLGR